MRLEENNSLVPLPKFIGTNSGGRINATGWANTILRIYALIVSIVKKAPTSNSSWIGMNYAGLINVIGNMWNETPPSIKHSFITEIK